MWSSPYFQRRCQREVTQSSITLCTFVEAVFLNDFQINEDGGAVMLTERRTGRVNLSKKADDEISGNLIPRINRSYVERALTPLDGVGYAGSNLYCFFMIGWYHSVRTPSGSPTGCLYRTVFDYTYMHIFNWWVQENYFTRPIRHPAEKKVFSCWGCLYRC